MNSIKLVERKIGLSLRLENLTYENIYAATNKLLKDPAYRWNIKALSEKFHNETIDPVNKTLDCIDLLIETGKTCYTISPENEVRWFEKYLVDIVLVITVPLVVLMGTLVLIFRQISYFVQHRILRRYKVAHEKVT